MQQAPHVLQSYFSDSEVVIVLILNFYEVSFFDSFCLFLYLFEPNLEVTFPVLCVDSECSKVSVGCNREYSPIAAFHMHMFRYIIRIYKYLMIHLLVGEVMKHPSCKRLKYLMKDEKSASKTYKSYGYIGLSKDESRHRKFLMKRFKKKCKG